MFAIKQCDNNAFKPIEIVNDFIKNKKNKEIILFLSNNLLQYYIFIIIIYEKKRDLILWVGNEDTLCLTWISVRACPLVRR